jgi:hypothetical protein
MVIRTKTFYDDLFEHIGFELVDSKTYLPKYPYPHKCKCKNRTRYEHEITCKPDFEACVVWVLQKTVDKLNQNQAPKEAKEAKEVKKAKEVKEINA